MIPFVIDFTENLIKLRTNNRFCKCRFYWIRTNVEYQCADGKGSVSLLRNWCVSSLQPYINDSFMIWWWCVTCCCSTGLQKVNFILSFTLSRIGLALKKNTHLRHLGFLPCFLQNQMGSIHPVQVITAFVLYKIAPCLPICFGLFAGSSMMIEWNSQSNQSTMADVMLYQGCVCND